MAYQRRNAAPKPELETIEGKVEAIGRGGKGIKIGDDWYGAYSLEQTAGVEVGDEVGFEFALSEKGGQTFRNIKGNVEVLNKGEAPARQQRAAPSSSRAAPQQRQSSPAPDVPYYDKNVGYKYITFPIPADHPDRSIIRQNAATRALEVLKLYGEPGDSPEAVVEVALDLARLFEGYYSGEV